MNASHSFRVAEAEPPQPPSNMDAEHALIGAVMFDADAYLAVRDVLSAEQFYEPLHQRLWSLMAEQIEAKRQVVPAALIEALKTDKAFEELGGPRYLADLAEQAPPASTAPEHARIVADLHVRRQVIAIAQAAIRNAADPQRAGYTVASDLRREIEGVEQGSAPGDATLIDARSSARTTLDEFEREAKDGKPKGFMTGLRCFDRRLRGLRPGHLVIVGGRPSMAKTGLARQAAMGCAVRNPGVQVAFFALEMDRRELDERTLSELSYRFADPIPYQDMSGDKLTHSDLMALRQLEAKVPENLIVDDSASLTVDYVRRRVWSLKRKGPLAAVFIDYLQIMDRPEARGRNDAALLGEMTKELKTLARAAKCAVVLLSQLSRGVEQRDNKRPQLSDLRESGAIEQDANSVLFPFREVYYLERAEPKAGTPEHMKWEEEVEINRRRMDVICAKNRGGAVGTDRQVYFAEYDVIDDDTEEQS